MVCKQKTVFALLPLPLRSALRRPDQPIWSAQLTTAPSSRAQTLSRLLPAYQTRSHPSRGEENRFALLKYLEGSESSFVCFPRVTHL